MIRGSLNLAGVSFRTKDEPDDCLQACIGSDFVDDVGAVLGVGVNVDRTESVSSDRVVEGAIDAL